MASAGTSRGWRRAPAVASAGDEQGSVAAASVSVGWPRRLGTSRDQRWPGEQGSVSGSGGVGWGRAGIGGGGVGRCRAAASAGDKQGSATAGRAGVGIGRRRRRLGMRRGRRR